MDVSDTSTQAKLHGDVVLTRECWFIIAIHHTNTICSLDQLIELRSIVN